MTSSNSKWGAGVYSGNGYKYTSSIACHVSHPPYPVSPGFVVYGGSGEDPKVKGCDIYISLSSYRVPVLGYPWRPSPVQDIVFPIRDGQVPTDPGEFRDMIEWLAGQVVEGKKVHIGCMAGHGRTGLVLAALRAYMAADGDAIKHVRDNYCSRAVESRDQVKFLTTHFGCFPVLGSHESLEPISKRAAAHLPGFEPGGERNGPPEGKSKRRRKPAAKTNIGRILDGDY